MKMYKNNHRRNSPCSMDWTETKVRISWTWVVWAMQDLWIQLEMLPLKVSKVKTRETAATEHYLATLHSAANGRTEWISAQDISWIELCVIINMKLPRSSRNCNRWSRSFNGGDKMLSHAIAQKESWRLWRHQSMQHRGGCRIRWTLTPILLLQIT